MRSGQLAIPLVLAWALDDAVTPGDSSAALWAGLALSGVVLLATLGETAEVLVWAVLRPGVEHRTRTAAVRQALQLDGPFHRRTPRGELVGRATSDAPAIAYAFDVLGYGTVSALSGVVSVVLLILISPLLAAVVVTPLALGLAVSVVVVPRYRRHASSLQADRAEAVSVIEDSITGARVAKGIGAGEALGLRFQDVSDRLLDRGLRLARLDASYRAGLGAIPVLTTALVVIVGGELAVRGEIRPGQLVAAAAYIPLVSGACSGSPGSSQPSSKGSPRRDGSESSWRSGAPSPPPPSPAVSSLLGCRQRFGSAT